MAVCPCCGQPVAGGAPVASLSEAPVSHYERTILDVLVRAYPRETAVAHLVDTLYGDDPNGGPDDPEQTIRVLVSRLRKRLPEFGWTIPKSIGGQGNVGRYRLAPVEGG